MAAPPYYGALFLDFTHFLDTPEMEIEMQALPFYGFAHFLDFTHLLDTPEMENQPLWLSHRQPPRSLRARARPAPRACLFLHATSPQQISPLTHRACAAVLRLNVLPRH